MSTLQPGSTLQNGKYEIQRVLGQGGFGVTYLALQQGLNRIVAIKEFFMESFCMRNADTHHVTVAAEGSREFVERYRYKFLKEARNIAKLEHPNIVSIIDVFEENSTAYYVMKYAQNGSLDDKVKREGHLSEADATRYILKIANALRFVHQHKMTHLDVKPANILLSDNDEPWLIDFGLSKQYDAKTGEQTSSTPLGYSPGYAPIEQYMAGGAGTFSPESDIYSLGATFYKLLTGNTPPDASTVANDGLPVQELKEKGVSQQTIYAIFQAMEGLRKNRLHDMDSFIRMLERDAVPEPPRVSTIKPPLPPSNDFNSNMQELPERPAQQGSVVQSIGWNNKQALFVLVGEIAFAFLMLTFSRSIDTDSDGWALMGLYSALTIVILCYLYIKKTGISTKKWKRIRIISTFLCLANSMLLPIWNGSLTGTYLFLSISLSLISSFAFLIKESKSQKEVTSTNPKHSLPQENKRWSGMRNNPEKPNNASNSKRKKFWIWIILAVIVVVAICGILGIMNLNEDPYVYAEERVDGSLVFTIDGTELTMIPVEGGTFTMGATSEMTEPFPDEKPTHQVTLSSYYIGETEVTQALWKAVMGSNPSDFEGDNLPVERVSWHDCQTFISRLNSLTGKRFRLPTEAEWEFAARGGNQSRHTQFSGSSRIDDVAWYDGNSGDKTHPVKTKQPNELGLYDMSGNVWEWCQDWYGSYSSYAQTDPTGAGSGSDRVIRDGSWSNSQGGCRSSSRGGLTPGDSRGNLGLRLVLSQ